jgi:hypothetical protein
VATGLDEVDEAILRFLGAWFSRLHWVCRHGRKQPDDVIQFRLAFGVRNQSGQDLSFAAKLPVRIRRGKGFVFAVAKVDLGKRRGASEFSSQLDVVVEKASLFVGLL